MDQIDNGADVSFADHECPECSSPHGCLHHHYRRIHMASKKRKGGNKKKRYPAY